IAQTLSATVGKPVPLTLWASDVPMHVSEAEEELAARNRGLNAGRAPDSVAIIGGQVIAGSARGGGAAAVRPVQADITVNWRKHRGPGQVSFEQERIPLTTNRDPKLFLEATTT